MYSKLQIMSLVLLLSGVLETGEAANILVFAVRNSVSNFRVMEPLLRTLAARGHRVTVVSSFPQTERIPNYHDVDISPYQKPVQSNLSLNFSYELGKDPFTNMAMIWEMGYETCHDVLQSAALDDLYKSSTGFDLVMTHLFAYECFNVFAHKFDTPIVSFATSSAFPWANPRVGNPDHPAYVVNIYMNSHHDMSLYHRVYNTLAWLWSTVAVHPMSYDRTDELVRKYLDPSAPPAREIMRRTALVMVNSHFSILQARPLVPNFVEIGGIHIKDPKPLPKDLQGFLDGAVEGAVVFSLGSLVRASTMGRGDLHALMAAFAALPQRVVFKFEEALEDAPPNVLVKKWIPQRDLLGHPSVRVLMSHGGQASTIEAVHSGIPMVGMPLFSDQYNNIRSLESRGAAVMMEFRELTKDKVLEALYKVLNDPSFRQSAQRLSRQFRDRPLPALDAAVYWTEYVLRHEGAPQLRSPSADLPWYRFLLLDVAIVLTPPLILAHYVFRIILKYTLYCLLGVFISTKKSKYD